MQEGDGARERETQRGTWRAPVAKGEEHGGAYYSRCLHAPPCTCLLYESSQAHTVGITFQLLKRLEENPQGERESYSN